MAGPSSDIDVATIAQMLNADAAALARVLLPNGRELAGYYCVGSVEGEPGDSMKIHLRGPRQGGWADYSRSDSERGGKGDMLKLVQLTVAGGDMGNAVRWAKQWLGLDQGLDPGALDRIRRKAEASRAKAEREQAKGREATRRNAERLWQGASPLHLSPPALAYFKGRGIDFAPLGKVPGAIRFRSDVMNKELGRPLPAILSAMLNLDGSFAAVHRTYIDRAKDGRWIKHPDLAEPKKTLGAFMGAHIPLNKGACRKTLRDIDPGTAVECSEGIEDGLSLAMAFPHLRIVAAATLGNIGQLDLPAQAGAFTIIGQHDPAGSPAERSLEKQIAAQQLRAKQDGSGRQVLIRWPDPGFKDFNDQLRGVGK